MPASKSIIEVSGLKNVFGSRVVHDNVNFEVKKGEIIAIIGASGSGKTTLLRSILMLQDPIAGLINVFGTNVVGCSPFEAQRVRKRWGVMFQSGALFSSLTVAQNITFPMKEYSLLPRARRRELALLKISMVGLDVKTAVQYPGELSGGMIKRAAVARALALDPELLFLDEPTSGLDPESADGLDDLIKDLRNNLGLTCVMITHDLDTLWRITDRVVFLGDKKVLAALPIHELVQVEHPLIKAYFGGPRAKSRHELAMKEKDEK